MTGQPNGLARLFMPNDCATIPPHEKHYGLESNVTEQNTLPDYLRPGLDIVFVGINPGAYSAKMGRYFATPRNRFWTALNQSGIASAGRDLGPEDDARMNDYGIGFTDVVKRPSGSASDIRPAEFKAGAPVLQEKLLVCQPLVVCFNGLTGYKNYLRHALGVKPEAELGAQERIIGGSSVFVTPNPSPANAVFSLDVIASWYRQVGEFRDQVKHGHD
jgi:TDG/mug DNA glycosylase family protein